MAGSNRASEKEIAFFAMIEYLERYWKRGGSEELAGMLGDLHFNSDGSTMDPACWIDWEKAYDKAMNKTKADYNSERS